MSHVLMLMLLTDKLLSIFNTLVILTKNRFCIDIALLFTRESPLATSHQFEMKKRRPFSNPLLKPENVPAHLGPAQKFPIVACKSGVPAQ